MPQHIQSAALVKLITQTAHQRFLRLRTVVFHQCLPRLRLRLLHSRNQI
jgi:hypothetical protein